MKSLLSGVRDPLSLTYCSQTLRASCFISDSTGVPGPLIFFFFFQSQAFHHIWGSHLELHEAIDISAPSGFAVRVIVE